MGLWHRCAMCLRHRCAIAAFLAAHQPAIAALAQRAYTAAGGHYARLPPADRSRQATSDAQEFASALASDQVDVARIDRVMASGVDLAVML
jgi:hypothetical protein